MKHFMIDRRTFLGTISIAALTAIAMLKGVDVTMAMATIVGSIAAANAYERSSQTKQAEESVYRSEAG